VQQVLSPPRDVTRCLAFSPDGGVLAWAGTDREIRLWDLAARREGGTLIGHKDTVVSLAFTPDGRTLASGSWDRTVRLWHVPTAQALAVLPEHGGRVFAVAFSPDSRTLASGGEVAAGRGEVRLWQAGR